MAELDPAILFAGMPQAPDPSSFNDPRVIAEKTQAAFQLQQMQRQQKAQNMLAQVFKQPGSFTPDGQIAPNALKQIMQVDPQTGMAYAKQNRETQLENYQIQTQQLVNQLKQTEIGQNMVNFLASADVAGVKAYDDALKANPADKAGAISKATQARNERLTQNGGQISEQVEQQWSSTPFDYDKAKIHASFDKDYVAQQKDERTEARLDRGETRAERAEAFTEKHETAQLGLERDRLALERQRERFEEGKPIVVGGDSTILDPKTRQIITPGEGGQYTGGLTPRARNGGDNPDDVVDRKMGFIASKLGVDLDTPLTPQQLQGFRDAYIKTEGSKTNNVGNLKNPNGQGFQQFGSRQAGVMAIDNQIQRDYKRGQTTIRSLIEGTPQSGGGQGRNRNVEATAQAIAHYDMAPLTGFVMKSAYGQNVMARAQQIAKDEGRTWDATLYDEKKAFQHGMGSLQPNTPGGQIYAANTATAHLGALAGLARELHNGNVPAANAIKNYIAKNFGIPNVGNFTVAREIVMDEVLKAIKGGVINEQEQKRLIDSVNSSGSWEQLRGAIDTVQGLLVARLGSLRNQYEQVTLQKDFDRYLLPTTRSIIKRSTGEGQTQPASQKFNVPDDIAAIIKKHGGA